VRVRHSGQGDTLRLVAACVRHTPVDRESRAGCSRDPKAGVFEPPHRHLDHAGS
jgi:hypothetical protein